MGIDLVVCNPIPVYGNMVTGVAVASGILATIGGIVTNNPIIAAIGAGVTVYGVLSILKCVERSFIEEKPSTVAREIAEKVEEVVKPKALVETFTSKIVGEAVKEALP